MREAEIEVDEEFEPDEPDESRNIAPTLERQMPGDDHPQPWPPRDRTGRRWMGYSRIKNRPARRKANRRRAKRADVAARKQGMALKAAGVRTPSLIEARRQAENLQAVEEALRKATKR